MIEDHLINKGGVVYRRMKQPYVKLLLETVQSETSRVEMWFRRKKKTPERVGAS